MQYLLFPLQNSSLVVKLCKCPVHSQIKCLKWCLGRSSKHSCRRRTGDHSRDHLFSQTTRRATPPEQWLSLNKHKIALVQGACHTWPAALRYIKALIVSEARNTCGSRSRRYTVNTGLWKELGLTYTPLRAAVFHAVCRRRSIKQNVPSWIETCRLLSTKSAWRCFSTKHLFVKG